jgi:hypothetical protein
MSGPEPEPCFIDTNIWLYALIENDAPGRSARAKLLIETRSAVIVSTQVINEVCVNLIESVLTMQPGAEGSSPSLLLSLLVDQCLLLHPDQLAQLQHRQPAFTVGSLINRIKVESVLTVIREVLTAPDPKPHLQQLSDTSDNLKNARGAYDNHHTSS